jgi:hypothetical protein
VEPESERHRLAGQEVGQTTKHLQLSFLHYIGRIYACPQLLVESPSDEAAQVLLMSGEKLSKGRTVASPSLLEQFAGLSRIRRRILHANSLLMTPAKSDKNVTAEWEKVSSRFAEGCRRVYRPDGPASNEAIER